MTSTLTGVYAGRSLKVHAGETFVVQSDGVCGMNRFLLVCCSFAMFLLIVNC